LDVPNISFLPLVVDLARLSAQPHTALQTIRDNVHWIHLPPGSYVTTLAAVHDNDRCASSKCVIFSIDSRIEITEFQAIIKNIISSSSCEFSHLNFVVSCIHAQNPTSPETGIMPPINHVTDPVILVENNHKPRLLPLLVLNLVQCQRHWRANHPSDILLISESRNWIWFTGTRPSTICKHIKMFSESLLHQQHDYYSPNSMTPKSTTVLYTLNL
jgi:hypothetical protein